MTTSLLVQGDPPLTPQTLPDSPATTSLKLVCALSVKLEASTPARETSKTAATTGGADVGTAVGSPAAPVNF